MHQITSILLRTAARPITAIDIWNFFLHPFNSFLFVFRAQAESLFLAWLSVLREPTKSFIGVPYQYLVLSNSFVDCASI